MNVAEIYRFIEDPSSLSDTTVPVLRQIIDRYPYFQSAKLLYLKNLALVGDPALEGELKRMAVSLPDRRKLFMLLEGERYGLPLGPDREQPQEKADAFSLIDDFLTAVRDEKEKEKEAGTPLLFQPSAAADYFSWAQADKNTQEEAAAAPDPEAEQPENPLQHQDLIDSFLQKEEERASGKGFDLEDDDPSEAPESEEALGEPRPKPLDDSYFTETLARIYVKQKRYEKAMQIIKNLSLKYPEKNVYFADQIRFLEKLIINTKK